MTTAAVDGAADKSEGSKTEFQKLLGDLDTLTKGMSKDDDEKIDAAADEGDPKTKKKVKGELDLDKDEDEGKPMTKSMTVTLEDGSTVEAVDGSELVKALTDQVGALTSRIESGESDMVKALGTAVTLIKAQGEQLTALQAQVRSLGAEGRGRKAVVSLVEKKPEQPLAKGAEGLTVGDFMAKAESGFKSGKVSGPEICFIESAINRGDFGSIPPSLVKTVAAL